MTTQFTKMHGTGNDFVVIDAINQSFTPDPEQVRLLADRHFGIGCDQLLLVETSDRDGVDFRYRIFNADGGEVQQCGNGARCFARFVREKGLTNKDEIVVETASGIITLYLEEGGLVRVNMGVPDFRPASLPLKVDQQQPRYAIDTSFGVIEVGAVSMGNPHLVYLVNSAANAPVETLGPELESHPLFPERVNAGFMEIVDQHTINLRVFERGSGETLACGTGACAAVAVAQQWGLVGSEVNVHLQGGELLIRWQGINEPLWMIGAAETVFEGSF